MLSCDSQKMIICADTKAALIAAGDKACSSSMGLMSAGRLAKSPVASVAAMG